MPDLQPAFVLHTWPYQESSLLVDIFTKEYGRINLIARGAKRKKSIAARLLHPFMPLLLSWRGRGQLFTLTHIELLRFMRPLIANKLISGLYINELIIRLCKANDPHPELFLIYQQAIESLAELDNTSKISEQKILRKFEKNLLQQIGYELILTKNIVTDEIIEPGEKYYVDLLNGPILIKNLTQTNIKQNIINSHTHIIHNHLGEPMIFVGESLLALAVDQLSTEEQLLAAKQIMRRALASHLGNKPLVTREFYFSAKS